MMYFPPSILYGIICSLGSFFGKKQRSLVLNIHASDRFHLNSYLPPKNCFQCHEIHFGHHQQSLKGILAHGSYVPAILWQCLRPNDNFRGYFFPIFAFRTQSLVPKELRFG